MEESMNEDIFKGYWKQLKGRAKSAWAELTDDDLMHIEGRRDVLAGKLQERYGWTREEAENEIESFLARSEAELRDIDIDR
jgi:uncharacterized protein YjbJ (UPF0337 family)